ncbi:hypothetical protein PVAND_004721 [Polypedilum vanderplanki]|uniref:Ubiquinone biosynthesis O-methyltransferase, mitochondrial n=1 Tax=Polypedilum vanderplanki TaxID=319348 RepID=A0A9J6BYY5_POLVA|nr:hypothetical protein PVAND_004721 [Polypedilum vanderplanki]
MVQSDKELLDRNILPSEQKSFSPLAKDWWNKKNGPLCVVHDMNDFRIKLIFDYLISTGVLKPWQRNQPDALQGLKILDLGCGGGILTEPLARLKAQMTGIDPNEDLIAVAKEHIEHKKDISDNVVYLTETIEEHCEKFSNYYDLVICSEVLDHVPDRKSILVAASVLKNGGSIFVSTFNKTFWSWFLAIVCGEYILRAIPIGTHHYKMFISPQDVSDILKELNFKTKSVKGFIYNFITRKFYVHNWIGFSYALHAVKGTENSTE